MLVTGGEDGPDYGLRGGGISAGGDRELSGAARAGRGHLRPGPAATA